MRCHQRVRLAQRRALAVIEPDIGGDVIAEGFLDAGLAIYHQGGVVKSLRVRAQATQALHYRTHGSRAPGLGTGSALSRVVVSVVVASVLMMAAGTGATTVDLGDRWAPEIFAETSDRPQSYRRTFVALANEEVGQGREWDVARRDRHFELYGIFPSFSVIRARLLDEARHVCHASIDDGALSAATKTLAPWSVSSKPSTALAVVQRHLRCEALLDGKAGEGMFDSATQEALRVYQRRHMSPSAGVIDAETREALLTDSRELDFRTPLARCANASSPRPASSKTARRSTPGSRSPGASSNRRSIAARYVPSRWSRRRPPGGRGDPGGRDRAWLDVARGGGAGAGQRRARARGHLLACAARVSRATHALSGGD